jgi:thiol-disulfide isomerase/thioredoxin
MVQDAKGWTTLFTRANQLLRATTHPAAVQLPIEGSLPSLAGATQWLNSPPLTPAALRGKVILVDFWTYTCINWLRTLPYLRAWADKYKDQGMVVLGVHTPEFDVEHDLDNVRRAVKDLRVHYPVAVDNDYAIWSAFDNHYWPALYLVDAQGHWPTAGLGQCHRCRSRRRLGQPAVARKLPRLPAHRELRVPRWGGLGHPARLCPPHPVAAQPLGPCW